MITLYQFQISPFCDKVRRIMNWKQLDYEIQEISLMKLLGIKKKYPVGKLPFIEHNGKTVGDSTDIAYYLEEQFPENPIIPKDPGESAWVHFFEDWSDESLYYYEMRLRFGIAHNAKKTIPELAHADSGIIKALSPLLVSSTTKSTLNHQGLGKKSDVQILIDVNRHVEAVGNHLQGKEWLVGSALSLADISVFAQLFCIRDSIEGGEIISGNSAVSNWMDRVDEKTGKDAK